MLEDISVFSGIASVWYSRKESILTYPVGLINTIVYIYLSVKGSLFGEATVNFYYTVMSIYGWYIWAKRNPQHEHIVRITHSNRHWLAYQLIFFSLCYVVIFSALRWMQKEFAPDAIPWGDAFASATAFTGMWLMTKKKVESWYWWILTNIASIPLYFTKGFVFTSFYYFVLLVFAFWGLAEWRKRAASTTVAK